MNDIEYLKKYLPKDKLKQGLEELKNGRPVQYIIGNVNFYGNTIKVNENVLIPRFETELLIEKTVNYAKKNLKEPLNIIDLGTGSGAIAITLKKLLNCNMEAIDISEKALSLARENADLNNVEIDFYFSDMLNSVKGKFDIIISNPPYIAPNEEVPKLVKDNEPAIALYALENGLYFYKKILKKARKYLKKQGFIALEIGMSQGNEVKELALKYFPDHIVTIEKDLPGKDRYVFVLPKNYKM